VNRSIFVGDLGLAKVADWITGIHKGVYIKLPIPPQHYSDQDWAAKIIEGLNKQLQQTTQFQQPAKEQG
jgi:hypothetical protein